jgi:hypothetical protein
MRLFATKLQLTRELSEYWNAPFFVGSGSDTANCNSVATGFFYSIQTGRSNGNCEHPNAVAKPVLSATPELR